MDSKLTRTHGRDPAWTGAEVASKAPLPRDFPLAVTAGPILYAFPANDDPDPHEVDPAPVGAAVGPIRRGPYRPQGAPREVDVDIVPHMLGWDAERHLWYCDIVVMPGDVYFPFIRLALARFQPNAVGGLELSAPVLSDFAQLAPDRHAILTQEGLDPRRRTISVYGNTPFPSEGLPHGSIIRCELHAPRGRRS